MVLAVCSCSWTWTWPSLHGAADMWQVVSSQRVIKKTRCGQMKSVSLYLTAKGWPSVPEEGVTGLPTLKNRGPGKDTRTQTPGLGDRQGHPRNCLLWTSSRLILHKGQRGPERSSALAVSAELVTAGLGKEPGRGSASPLDICGALVAA